MGEQAEVEERVEATITLSARAARRQARVSGISKSTWLIVGMALWSRSANASSEPIDFYFERPIVAAELRGKTLRELELMRAMIYAHAGLVSLDWWVRDYLAGQAWYQPGKYDPARLTAVDQQNLKTLASYRASIPRAELTKRWHELLRDHRFATEGSLQHRLAFSENGELIAVGASTIYQPHWPLSLFRTGTGERIRSLRWATGELTALQFAGNDLVLAAAYDVWVTSAQSAFPRLSLMVGAKALPDGHRDPPPHWACVSPDGTTAVVEREREVTSWSLTTRRLSAVFPKPFILPGGGCSFVGAQRVFVRSAQFGPDFLIDLSSRSVVPLTLPKGNSVISPTGAWLARWDQTYEGPTGDVEIWRLGQTPERVRVLSGSAGAERAAFSPDGSALLTADRAGRVVHWSIPTGARTLWRDRTERIDTSHTSSDELNGWWGLELTEDLPPTVREALPDPATALRFSPDGRFALVSYQGGSLQLFDAATGKLSPGFRGHESWPENELWEATLIARALGMRLDPTWPRVPEFVEPFRHLAALDARLPEGVIQGASRGRLRVLRNAIVARRGGSFENPLLKSLLAAYKPIPGYTPDRLTAIDRENIMRIKRRERALGGPIGDAALHLELWGAEAG